MVIPRRRHSLVDTARKDRAALNEELIMERINETVDLGRVTEETRGGDFRATEDGGKLPVMAGIADDD